MALGVAFASAFILLTLTAFVASENVAITCGSTFKLAHIASKFRLHSHDIAYSRGSQQQSVTAYEQGNDYQSYWTLYATLDAPCTPGTTFKKGSSVRLQHAQTRKWLHSHQYYSPLSQNQEVSAFGSDGDSDGGDVWLVEWDGKSKVWRQDTKVRLKHRDTGAYLYSHEQAKFGHPIAGQQEVCATERKDKNTEWQAAEGVYLPVPSKKDSSSGDAGAGSTGSDEL
mmetsp:Transcript_40117/g.89039  ORF Transcript_40117/g.89039 Transcript_40117/m.89039 type:complete len:226 (+) Transcript_40117:135-812(+)|eukprot:CAMPEP_0202901204 /NCGR_PEP_ID=MMETSP1392-20130828/13955_1 /ASSEMBLY_ACC=CAM_ASM_000868 /TAXON_ID=225041 /ORGANISM="Chlamydomonas chlamydogama, Strain SAG 11-48b" /LENGTH=225 /DNA_ID=CAMNT_0049587733 /DNA_START=113 /DNA_END=790 /DNA_ORIENTATION=-